MLIYKITNLINGKLYIGQTKNSLNERWELHKRDFEIGRKAKYPLYCAFAKYGLENFTVEVIHDNIDTFEDLDYWEKYYIKTLNTKSPNGYNLTDGGQGIHGYHHTEETKRIIGEKVKQNANKIYTPERSQKISKANKGKKFSVEHKRKLSVIAQQRTGDKNPFFGRTHTDETKHKSALKLSKTYYQIDKITGEILNRFECPRDAAEYIQSLHITKASLNSIMHGIRMCSEGRYSNSYGYIWKSVDKQ